MCFRSNTCCYKKFNNNNYNNIMSFIHLKRFGYRKIDKSTLRHVNGKIKQILFLKRFHHSYALTVWISTSRMKSICIVNNIFSSFNLAAYYYHRSIHTVFVKLFFFSWVSSASQTRLSEWKLIDSLLTNRYLKHFRVSIKIKLETVTMCINMN